MKDDQIERPQSYLAIHSKMMDHFNIPTIYFPTNSILVDLAVA
jgi:hypothetical protein